MSEVNGLFHGRKDRFFKGAAQELFRLDQTVGHPRIQRPLAFNFPCVPLSPLFNHQIRFNPLFGAEISEGRHMAGKTGPFDVFQHGGGFKKRTKRRAILQNFMIMNAHEVRGQRRISKVQFRGFNQSFG